MEDSAKLLGFDTRRALNFDLNRSLQFTVGRPVDFDFQRALNFDFRRGLPHLGRRGRCLDGGGRQGDGARRHPRAGRGRTLLFGAPRRLGPVPEGLSGLDHLVLFQRAGRRGALEAQFAQQGDQGFALQAEFLRQSEDASLRQAPTPPQAPIESRLSWETRSAA